MKEIPTDSLQACKKLHTLNLSGCGINALSDEKPSSLSSLRVLYLEDCGLQGAIQATFFKQFEKLEKLSLSRNKINTISGEFDNPKLKKLFLNKNYLKEGLVHDNLKILPSVELACGEQL